MDEEEFEDKSLMLDEDEDALEEEENPLEMGFHEEHEPESDF